MTELWDPAIADNPEAFVMFAYPWDTEGTPLVGIKGPRNWQRDELQSMADHIRSNKIRMEMGLLPKVYQSATSSGRGVGKSALFAMLAHWMMSCHIGSTTIATANTEGQLKSKTWAELGKWLTLAINRHWFDVQAMSLKPADWFKKQVEKDLKIDGIYYYAQATLWSEETPEAFAGAHNPNGMLQVFDEASGIPGAIWEVAESVYSEPVLHRYWFTFSNPRRNTGVFYECFHPPEDKKTGIEWKCRVLDSRQVEGTDVDRANGIVAKYGEDSDTARVEVKGQFPRQSEKQFISRETVDGAVARETTSDAFAPLIMGVDPARFGNNSSVIRFRQGRNARIIPQLKFERIDNVVLAQHCADAILKYDPDAVCIDSGAGSGVIDILKHLGYKIFEIHFGGTPTDLAYADIRTELWAKMRDWLSGGMIDNSQTLKDDLVAPEYGFVGKGNDKLKLESKDHMERRGVKSPDEGDALALTFAINPNRRDKRTHRSSRRVAMAKGMDYNLFGE